jgi:alkylation response protein AidB-like acyl-CoA dehydrogenase
MSKSQSFGDPLPFCEPSWYQGFATPYYKESHIKYRNKVRAFVDKYKNKQDKWFKEGAYPLSLHEEIYQLEISGILYPEKYGGFKEKGDYFHEQILWDELARLDYGIVSGALSINSMASPPIIKAAHEDLKQKILPDLVKGKNICEFDD